MRHALIRIARALLLAALAGGLAACGFQLRGAQTLPYQRLYLDLPEHAELTADLRRAIAASQSAVVGDRQQADAVFSAGAVSRDKAILSLNSAGRARELQLRFVYNYRLTDRSGRDLIAPGVVALTRDYSFDDAQVLAKEQEETLLWRDMEKDVVQQVMRRLAIARPAPAAPATR